MSVDIVNKNIELRKKQHISFSEYHIYRQCPYRWYLQHYIGHKEPTNEFLVFGSSMHETIEEILKDSSKKNKTTEILKQKIKTNSNGLYSDSFFGKTMVSDGSKILKDLDFYNRFKGIDIAGIEDDIYLPLIEIEGVMINFKAFIDFLGQYQKEERYLVLDWKTALQEWNLEKKVGILPFATILPKLQENVELDRQEFEDMQAKYFFGQTALYQHFVAEKYDLDISKIDVEYCALIRKTANVKEYRINVTSDFREWILKDIKDVAKDIYTFDNSYTLPKVKIERKLKKYCNYCPFKKDKCSDDCNQIETKETNEHNIQQ